MCFVMCLELLACPYVIPCYHTLNILY
jgi:hypothetical protein